MSNLQTQTAPMEDELLDFVQIEEKSYAIFGCGAKDARGVFPRYEVYEDRGERDGFVAVSDKSFDHYPGRAEIEALIEEMAMEVVK